MVSLVTQAFWAELRRSGETVEISQWSTLKRIDRSPCTMSELARYKGVGLPTISKSVDMLVRRGLVVERDGCWFHPDAVAIAAQVAARLLRDRPEGFTMSELREALGNTRKHALPLAAELDARGVTRRRGDLRIAGPRLPAAD